MNETSIHYNTLYRMMGLLGAAVLQNQMRWLRLLLSTFGLHLDDLAAHRA
jgi:hypothetical protein